MASFSLYEAGKRTDTAAPISLEEGRPLVVALVRLDDSGMGLSQCLDELEKRLTPILATVRAASTTDVQAPAPFDVPLALEIWKRGDSLALLARRVQTLIERLGL